MCTGGQLLDVEQYHTDTPASDIRNLLAGPDHCTETVVDPPDAFCDDPYICPSTPYAPPPCQPVTA